MLKIFRFLLISFTGIFVLVQITGCGAGNNPQISAAVIPSGSSCSNLTTNSSCAIQITYNTNGATGLTLGYTPNPLSAGITNNDTFNTTFQACQQQVATSTGQGSCIVTIIYTSGFGDTNESVAFTLGSATSNAIPITGD